ncbi:MAG: HDOD domain-containing protein [Acidobacteria bacterium]|nr:HDOD domain-containing protein [Acidobacteriota bacterium]
MAQTQTQSTQLLEDLPPFPPVAARLTQALEANDADIGEIVDLVGSDPALAADIVRRANSPAYGFGRRVDSVREALVLLGFAELHRLTLARATAALAGGALHAFPALRRCWRNSLAVAAVAEQLAGVVGLSADKAYTAGLLHDIGRLGLLSIFPTQYSELLLRAAREAPPDDVAYLLDTEQLIFGIDHCSAGRVLTERWEMPVEIQQVAGRHHDRIEGSDWGFLELIQGAVTLAEALGFGALDREARLTMDKALERFPDLLALEVRIRTDDIKDHVDSRIAKLDGDVTDSAAEGGEADEAPPAEAEGRKQPEEPIWLIAAACGLVVAAIAAGALAYFY